ncbi:putative cytosol aminopeptidase [Rhodospirillaceae bacterium LM-1]|nr:putative cytosol aminopeptidase [Rhodospirillaceae bacterium LM-1]
MKIVFAKPAMPQQGVLIVGVLEGRKKLATAQLIDAKTKGALKKLFDVARFEGRTDQVASLMVPPGLKLARVIAIGLGKASDIDEKRLEAFGAKAATEALASGEAEAALAVDAIPGCKLGEAAMAARMALGASLKSWRFDRYFTTEKADDKPKLKTFTLLGLDVAAARKAFLPLNAVAEGVRLTRELQSEPANIIHPESMAARARELIRLGVKVEILGEAQMKRLGMNALLGVGQGSARESKLVVMRWTGSRNKQAAPIAIVGKGVTFDSGGISIKPAGGMEEMKWDMSGAAVVYGLMKALAGRKAKVNVVGVAGLVENMPSGTAQRPGDVVKSMSGQTIEVINTDAEGRLVLADALWYCQNRFKPTAMIDLATLTGAILVALGSEYAGLFSNDDKLCERLASAGESVGEPLWRLPMGEAYDKMIKSDIADMKNIGDGKAGSITAAQFLKRFVNNVPWAHLDIAGTAWAKKDLATVPKGAAAFGVRLLDRFLQDNYER